MARYAILLVFLLAGCARPALGEEISGLGRTVDDAKRDARQHVLEELQRRLDLPDYFTPWQPSLAEVERLLENKGRAGAVIDFKELGLQYQWLLPVQFPSDAELQRRGLRARRQVAVAGTLAAVIAATGAWWFLNRMRSNRSPV